MTMEILTFRNSYRAQTAVAIAKNLGLKLFNELISYLFNSNTWFVNVRKLQKKYRFSCYCENCMVVYGQTILRKYFSVQIKL